MDQVDQYPAITLRETSKKFRQNLGRPKETPLVWRLLRGVMVLRHRDQGRGGW